MDFQADTCEEQCIKVARMALATAESTIKVAVYFHFMTSKMSEQKIALVVRRVL